MKLLSILTVLLLNLANLNTGKEHISDYGALAVAATISEQASITESNYQPGVEDHYGNPDQFIQYIIRVPPIHV